MGRSENANRKGAAVAMSGKGLRYLSLFSGMEAAHLAWHPLGWECVGVAEIDPNACVLLKHRLPQVPNLGSVTDITDDRIAALGRIDVVIGGSPCQDLSVAGKRAGLAGARSGLFHEQLRIFDAARTLCGARWLVWENVPGAFSSNAGRDFAVVAGAMAGLDLAVPRDGWGNEGVAVGPNGLVEWSVLDAQWFGVAQRRRRVFAVLDTGNWADRPPLLLEPDSLRGDSAPRREAGEGTAARAAASVALRGREGGGPAELGDDCAFTLRASSGGGDKPHALTWPAEVASTLNAAFGDKLGLEDQHALHGAPLFVPALPECVGALTAQGPGTYGAPEVDAGQVIAVSAATFMADDYKEGTFEQTDTARPLTTSADRTRAAPIAAQAMAVRRLTPRECERLQGAEDDWTLVPNAKGKPMADGPRYKMLGNSFAVPVIRWIGRQIERATAQSQMEQAA